MKLIFKILKRLIKFLFYNFLFINFLILIIPLLFSPSCKENKNLNKFDAIIVLGSPSKENCTPHIIMQKRVDKAIELFNKGIASTIIFTGSSVQNSCSDADVMAIYAMSKGIPKNSIIIENKAQNTYQNAYYSLKIIKKHSFSKAAIVTSAPHIKRACIIFGEFKINYKMFPAYYPKDTSQIDKLFWFMGERMILTHHLIFGFPKNFNSAV
jgi:uncharacterized SAM-binding protein YcdF (DUF218 family)